MTARGRRPPGVWRRALGDHAPTLVIAGIALAVGLWADLPNLADPATLAPRTQFTPGQTLAAAVAVAQAHGGGFATWTPLLGWPDGADYRAVMWPTQLAALLVGPLPAVNLAFVTIPALNALAGGWLGRAAGLDRWGAATVAATTAGAPWAFETMANGQLEQAVVGVVAALWALGIRLRGGPAAAVGMAAAALAAGLTAPHLLMGAGLGLGVHALLRVGPREPRHSGRAAGGGLRRWRVAGLAGALLGALVALAYQAGNFSAGTQVLAPKGSITQPVGMAAFPEAASFARLVHAPSVTGEVLVLHPNYLGLVVLVVAGVGLARRPSVAAPALVTAGLLVLFALGRDVVVGGLTLPGPYRLLELVAPAIRESASPYRMLGAAVVALAVAAGAAVRGPVGLVLVTGLAWADAARAATRPLPWQAMRFARDPVVEPFLRPEGAAAGPILDLPPVGPACPDAGYHYVFEALRRQRPTPVLVAAPVPYPTVPGLMRLLAAPSSECGEALARGLPGFGFTGVVLHEHDAGCAVPKRLVGCLEGAFGPGERVEGLRWWDPLPVPAGVEPGSLRRR